MPKTLRSFIVRWAINSLGLWVAARLLPEVEYQNKIGVILLASLVLTLINAVIRPIVVFLSLPAVLITLGLFMIVINGLMVLIVSRLLHDFQVHGFIPAMLAGLIIGLVNYLVTTILEDVPGTRKLLS